MDKMEKIDNRDKRDKRYCVPRRRRMKLPWFFVACIGMLVGLKWVSGKILPSTRGISQSHSTVGGSFGGQTNDW